MHFLHSIHRFCSNAKIAFASKAGILPPTRAGTYRFNETEKDRMHMMELAEMFLGYGKHFERLKKYGLSSADTLMSRECDEHIAFLSKETSINEFYVAILTDMIPYVVFSNYLLQSIGSSDNNPWEEYAIKYGDLNNHYAKDKLGKTIKIVNEILV